MKRKATTAFLLLIFGLFLCGCGTSVKEEGFAPQKKVTIASQYGLAYAPLQVMEKNKLMEKYYPGGEIVWQQMGTGPVIREAILAQKVDIGFMGASPFLIGWDKGAKWKVVTASACSPLGLVTYKEDIKDIKDFGENDRIASPAIASAQHILLAMAAEKELGNARALDSLQTPMTHPDALTALMGKKDLTAHFSGPPYLSKELEAGMHEVISGEEAFGGDFTFIFGVASESFHENNPMGYAAFTAAFSEAVAYINNNPREAARLLAPLYKLSEEEAFKYLTWEDTNFCTTPLGLLGFAKFMHKEGFISKAPKDLSEIAFENVQAAVGKSYGKASLLEDLQWRPGDR